MKNSNDIMGDRTRDLPACSIVPQPTAPPRARVHSRATFKHSLAQRFYVVRMNNKKKKKHKSIAIFLTKLSLLGTLSFCVVLINM